MMRFWRRSRPNVGYGLTVVSALFLGNIGLLLATLSPPAGAAVAHLMQVLAFAIVGSLAALLIGLNIARSHPLTDRSAMLWIWLLGFFTSRRLAEIALSVRWDTSLVLEAGLLCGAVLLVLMSAGRLAPEEAP